MLNDTNSTQAIFEVERLIYISKASLRLLRIYINEIYPNQGMQRIARQILSCIKHCI